MKWHAYKARIRRDTTRSWRESHAQKAVEAVERGEPFQFYYAGSDVVAAFRVGDTIHVIDAAVRRETFVDGTVGRFAQRGGDE